MLYHSYSAVIISFEAAAKNEAKKRPANPTKKKTTQLRTYNRASQIMFLFLASLLGMCLQCMRSTQCFQDTVLLILSQMTIGPIPKWNPFAEQVRSTHSCSPTVSPWKRSSQCMCRIIPHRLFPWQFINHT